MKRRLQLVEPGRFIDTEGRSSMVTRRTLLKWALRGGVALAGFPLVAKGLSAVLDGNSAYAVTGGAQGPWTHPGMSLEVTPTTEFYTVSKNLFDPHVDAASWRLDIDGLVHRPLTLDYNALTASTGTVEQYVTLTCISNQVGGDLAGNALWRGIRLRDLLRQAEVKPGAVDIVMEAHDNYTDSIPMEKAMHPDTLLVWEMNGSSLPPEHGYPARLIVPGIYGMKNVKWIRRITVVDQDYKGYWERRGWSDVARIKTWSRLDIPQRQRLQREIPVILGGVGFAGDRGIDRIEYSVDGVHWHEAQLKEALSPYGWRLWMAQWRPVSEGIFQLTVRATDGQGRIQTSTVSSPVPDGADGYHQITVQVRD